MYYLEPSAQALSFVARRRRFRLLHRGCGHFVLSKCITFGWGDERTDGIFVNRHIKAHLEFFCPDIKCGCSSGLTMPARMLEADDNKRYWCRPKCSTEMQWKDRLSAILIFWNTDQRKQQNDSDDGISLPAFLSNLEWANKGRVSLRVGSFSERLQSALQLNYRFKKCESARVTLIS